MDQSAYLVWWPLGIPVVVAIVDRMLLGKSSGSGTEVADGYVVRANSGSLRARA